MKALALGILAALVLLAAPNRQALAAEASEAPSAKPLAVGTAFPDVPLIGPVSPELADNLGIPQNGPTPIAKVKAECPPVDILVNNAGTILRKPAAEHPDEYWDRVIEINLNAQFVLAREIGKMTSLSFDESDFSAGQPKQ